MSQPKSLSAYADCESYFEQALASAKGIRIILEDASQATRIRLKLNSYRQKLREQSQTVYPTDHPAFGKSAYDQFILRIPKEAPSTILIEKEQPSAQVEEL